MMHTILVHIKDYLPYYLLAIYLLCLYFAYKGATSISDEDYRGSVGDELDLDDSENFY